MSEAGKAFLIIMDGWGLNADPNTSAIAAANTPFTDSLYQQYPHTTLLTFGDHVGLPGGQMGNSEVGHMNLGAGRVVWQDLLLIDKEIEKGSFFNNKALSEAFEYAATHQKTVHFLGLVSDGGIHSHISHLKALIKMAAGHSINKSYIHAITDGRDTDPKGGIGYLTDLQQYLQAFPTEIASICGRYYAMDRDKRWERVKKAYDLLVHGIGERINDPVKGLAASYDNDVTDEFVAPMIITDASGNIPGLIQEGDVVISFNFRTDRCREITQVLTQQDMPDWGMYTLPLYYLTMTIYDESFRNIKVAYGKDTIQMTLGEVLSLSGKTQVRMAETEKYPHVTFFFSGGREKPFPGEDRVLVNSPKVATYDLQPEMSAPELKDECLKVIQEKYPDFICLNFANTDMVGHTGVFSAAVRAAETVDACVKEVVHTALKKGYHIFLTADHGNADCMVNPDGSPNTAHSKNLVPLFYLNPSASGQLQQGKLADIAPSILHVMGIPIPSEMDGNILLA
jgi:2,3-bisphosphoglycerate-independent phosphoglycerate mutase